VILLGILFFLFKRWKIESEATIMVPKSFWRFYIITALLLASVAIVPLLHFVFLVIFYYLTIYHPLVDGMRANINIIVPFVAVLTAILIGFLIMPMLWNMNFTKRRILVSVGAVIVFFALELYAEMIAVRMNVFHLVLSSRMVRRPEDITALHANMQISWAVRFHYFVFSIVLVLAVLNFLYNLANALYGDGKPSKKVLTLHGIAMTCYALAFFFVRIMRFDDYTTLLLLWGSVLNAAMCFIFAAIAVGICSGTFMRFEGIGKFIPSLLSIATVMILYGAEYTLLDGNFYSYSESVVVTMLLRVLITVTPGVIVYFLLKYANDEE